MSDLISFCLVSHFQFSHISYLLGLIKFLLHSHSFVSFKENTCLYICLICVKNENLQYIEIIFKRFIPLLYLFLEKPIKLPICRNFGF